MEENSTYVMYFTCVGTQRPMVTHIHHDSGPDKYKIVRILEVIN